MLITLLLERFMFPMATKAQVSMYSSKSLFTLQAKTFLCKATVY